MAPAIWFHNGKLLFNNGLVAMNAACCCDSTGPCCCLQQYDAVGETPAQELTATVSGVLVGVITLTRILDDEGYCGTWECALCALDEFCDTDLNYINITLRCPAGATSVDDLELLVTGGGGECAIFKVGGGLSDPAYPDAGGSCTPLDVTFTDAFEVIEIIPEDCNCTEGGTITIRITV